VLPYNIITSLINGILPDSTGGGSEFGVVFGIVVLVAAECVVEASTGGLNGPESVVVDVGTAQRLLVVLEDVLVVTVLVVVD